MKVRPEQIPSAGLELSEACDPKALGLETGEVRFFSKLGLHCRFTRNTSDVFCQCEFSAEVRLLCSRCARPFEAPIAGDFHLYYPGGASRAVIDTSDDLRQEILLTYSMKPLCSPDCKGLCALCGGNLNERDCGHKNTSIESPFSKLKDLLGKKEKKTKESK